jgi:hypothetical protein
LIPTCSHQEETREHLPPPEPVLEAVLGEVFDQHRDKPILTS